MDDRHSAMLWQMMQNLGGSTQGGNTPDDQDTSEHSPLEHNLLTLRQLMPPRQQKIVDLMIKIQEVKALINEIQ